MLTYLVLKAPFALLFFLDLLICVNSQRTTLLTIFSTVSFYALLYRLANVDQRRHIGPFDSTENHAEFSLVCHAGSYK